MNKRSNIDKAIKKIDTKIAQAEITGKESYMYNDDIILMLNDFKSILAEEDSGVEVDVTKYTFFDEDPNNESYKCPKCMDDCTYGIVFNQDYCEYCGTKLIWPNKDRVESDK